MKTVVPKQRITLDITVPRGHDTYFSDHAQMREIFEEAMFIYIESQEDAELKTSLMKNPDFHALNDALESKICSGK